jgi:hypothetical protein
MWSISTMYIQFALSVLVFAPGGVVVGESRNARTTVNPHQGHQPTGFIDYALDKFSPEHKDYGTRLRLDRRDVVEHTVGDLYFWSNAVSLALLTGVTTLLFLHLRAAERKEAIASSLIAQLWNGRVSDRIEIERRTARFNQLVESHNATVERGLMAPRQESYQDRKTAERLGRSIEALAEKSETAFKGGSAPRSPEARTVTEAANIADASSLQQKNLLLQRQIEAIRNTEENLKMRLNQTISSLEKERTRNQVLKGA